MSLRTPVIANNAPGRAAAASAGASSTKGRRRMLA
eukprot:CAMPEP_0183405480 /NCGR_PEP_ID=MMETSP0370-20130417/15863_1 /TAXON_ID=268820 /ORGANISM="Peridinium aciculiferum, Strain PAER-2" /LENGTH=34 /DNA_ID= /DNA_START= /DNA_END= /DNA_ORIENTATION=